MTEAYYVCPPPPPPTHTHTHTPHHTHTRTHTPDVDESITSLELYSLEVFPEGLSRQTMALSRLLTGQNWTSDSSPKMTCCKLGRVNFHHPWADCRCSRRWFALKMGFLRETYEHGNHKAAVDYPAPGQSYQLCIPSVTVQTHFWKSFGQCWRFPGPISI